MKKLLGVATLIFTPVIVTLLLRLIIAIINLIFDDILDLFDIYIYDMFDFGDVWWFWLIAAILSFIAIFILLHWIQYEVEE